MGEPTFGGTLARGAASQAIGGIIDTPFSWITSAIGARQQRKLADYNYRLQRKLMHEIQEYNSPMNMRALHEAAGLNYQALMSGGGGSVGQASKSSAPPVSMPSVSSAGLRGMDPLTIGQGLSQIKLNESAAYRNYQEASLTPERRQLLEAQAVLAESQTTVNGFDSALKSIQLYVESNTADLKIDQVENDVRIQTANLNILYEQYRDWQFKNDNLNPAELQALQTNIRLTEQKIVTEVSVAALNSALAGKARVETEWIAPLAEAAIAERYSMANLNDKNAGLVEANKDKTEAEARITGIKADRAEKYRGFDNFMHVARGVIEIGEGLSSIAEKVCHSYALISGKDVNIEHTDKTVEQFFDSKGTSTGQKITKKIHNAKEAYEVGKAISSVVK